MSHYRFLSLAALTIILTSSHVPTSTARDFSVAKINLQIEYNGDITVCTAIEDYNDRIECLSKICEPNYQCTEALLIDATAQEGPVVGTKLLDDLLLTSTQFGLNTDGHELGHIIGRTTAKQFGFTGTAFMECPNDYLYACQHGFFEQVLGEHEGSTADVATEICESITKEPAGRNKFYCYHGVGHGIMMSRRNDIYETMRVCDGMPYLNAAQGCWQGGFMENINAVMTGQDKDGVFLGAADPLAPCSNVPLQYQWNCYENHSAYLMKEYENDIVKSAEACLKAHPETMPSCVLSLAQFATNPGWQTIVLNKRPDLGGKDDFIQNSVSICNGFPKGTNRICHMAAITNALNYNEVAQALEYCSYLDEEDNLKRDCYQRSGNEMYYHAKSQELRDELCNDVPKEYFLNCSTLGDVRVDMPPRTEGWSPLLNNDIASSAGTAETTIEESGFFAAIGKILRWPFTLFTSDDEPGGIADSIVIRLISSTEFSPREVFIDRNDSVTWITDTNDLFWPASDVHPTHELLSTFDAGNPLKAHQSYTYTFKDVGDWTFHDHLNPMAIGIVHVK
ncbi:MAG: hypothetical protein O2904_03650 [bacterium]|nr:hypothetical protein [bacterium]